MFSKYERKDIIQSVYCYPDTEVYINHFGVRDFEELHRVETDITVLRLSDLEAGLLKGKFGVTHLKNIHKYIFQDVYPFAGKIRVEDIWKGDTFFCKSEYIEDNLQSILGGLKQKQFFKDMDYDEIVIQLAKLTSDLNIIHPFREGNGRAIREFVRQLAEKNGYDLKWYKLDPESLLHATIHAVGHDMVHLEKCIKIALDSDE